MRRIRRISRPIPVTTTGELPNLIKQLRQKKDRTENSTEDNIEINILLHEYEEIYKYAARLEEYDRGAVKFALYIGCGLFTFVGITIYSLYKLFI